MRFHEAREEVGGAGVVAALGGAVYAIPERPDQWS
jgi:hypothetical protein